MGTGGDPWFPPEVTRRAWSATDVGRRIVIGLVAAALTGLAGPAVAHGADPGRWTFTGASTMPLYYYQGVTSDPAGHFYFDGVDFGLYRTDSQLHEQARNDDVIPPAVTAPFCSKHSMSSASGGYAGQAPAKSSANACSGSTSIRTGSPPLGRWPRSSPAATCTSIRPTW